MSVEKVRSIPVESEVLWRYRSNEIVRNYILFFFFFLRRVNNDVRVPLCGTAHAGWHQNVFVPFCLSNSRGRLLLDWLPKNVAFILLIPGRFILILLACVSPNGLNWSSLWEFPPDRIHSWSLLSISQKCELVGKKMHRSSWFCFMWLWHTRTYREDRSARVTGPVKDNLWTEGMHSATLLWVVLKTHFPKQRGFKLFPQVTHQNNYIYVCTVFYVKRDIISLRSPIPPKKVGLCILGGMREKSVCLLD